jgi:14-3-3 protein beta/theta/zeta
MLKDTKQACQMAKTAFNQSIACLDSVEDEHYKDSTLLMQVASASVSCSLSQPPQESTNPY